MSRLEQMLGFLEEDPDDSFTRYVIGLEYAGRNEYSTALLYLEELRRRDPAYLAVYYQLGQVYTAIEGWDKAEEAYSAGLTVARTQGDIHAISEIQAALDDLEGLRQGI